MTTEEKLLLLKDLCSRLPYEIIGLYTWKNKKPYDRELTGDLYDELKSSWNSTEDSQFLPYLRPMSSMTDEEYNDLCVHCSWVWHNDSENLTKIRGDYKCYDWLNSHHFDYRGLIEKGLALKAPEDMYKNE